MKKHALLLLVAAIVIFLSQSCRTAVEDSVKQGYSFIEEGRYEEALKSFDKAIESETGSLMAWTGRGTALAGLKRHKEALKAMDKVINMAADKGAFMDPFSASLWAGKGIIFIKLQDYDRALFSFDRAIALKPDYAEAWYGYALLYILKGDSESSLRNLAITVKLDPKLKRKIRSEKAFEPLWHNPAFNLLLD